MSWHEDGIQKVIDDSASNWGPRFQEIAMGTSGGSIQKIASQTYVPDSLLETMRDIQAAPDPSMAYFYDRAMGAGETYGPNNNGDHFSRQDLIDRHDTFVKVAKMYRHHKSKGPSIGDVMASAYNDRVDTVDLILRAPISHVQDEIERFGRGAKVATSMGAKVPFDVCSICGNKARRRMFYCEHLKRKMLRTHDGKLVFAYNPKPTFNDISIVVIGAEPTSMVIDKIASKHASIRKVDNSFEPGDRGVIKPEAVDYISRSLPPGDAIATMHHAFGVLRPDEFTATLRKEASLIRSDVVYYVSPEGRGSDFDMGYSHGKLAMLLKSAGMDSCGGPSEFADFMSKRERDLYTQYRRVTSTMPGPYLR